MKVLILLAVIAASQAAAIVYTYPYPYVGLTSAYQSQDAHGNYVFGYHSGKPDSASFHSESGSASSKVGSYGVASPDGKVRIVNYVADAKGFRADVKTNEKVDKDAETPADVTVQEAEVKPAPAVVSYFPHHGYAVSGPTYHYVVY